MTAPAPVFPGLEWATATPADVGLDRDALDRATDTIFAIEKRYGVLFIKDGHVVHERYRRDASATTTIFSITKGFGATLIGIAERQGLLSVDDRVSDWLPVHHPDIAPDARISHLLNMTASREPAGSYWAYNSHYILNSLTGILWLASGLTPVQFYERHLRLPLGLSFEWPSNPKGWVQIGSQGPLPVIEATHRDIARLGLLWMNGGQWNGQALLAPGFVERGLTAESPDVNGAYGFLWWLNRAEGNWRSTGGKTDAGSWFPFAAPNVFMALGARGKVMIVCPDHNLIMVSMGDTPQEQSGNYLEVMMRAVCDILPGA